MALSVGAGARWKHLLALVGSTGATGIAPIEGGPQQTDIVAAVKQRMEEAFTHQQHSQPQPEHQASRKRGREGERPGAEADESLLGITLRHHPNKGTVSIEMSETMVLMLYISGFAILISGLSLGCCLWQREQRKQEPCECPMCRQLYRERRKLGTGGFGEAALVQRGGRPYVLKKIACPTVNAANQALLEAACLQRLRHPGVVRFEDVFLHRGTEGRGGCSAVIVMEFCAGGDLIDRLECSRGEAPLTERQHLGFLEQLAAALAHVHRAGILHRDLKSSNVLVTRNDRAVKLADFGLSTWGLSARRLNASPRRMSRCGTAMYMAPEVQHRKPYGAQADVYGLGCVLLEMLTRQQLRERAATETRREFVQAVLAAAAKHEWEAHAACSDLAVRLLEHDPKKRATLAEVSAALASVTAALPALSERAEGGGGDGGYGAKQAPPAGAARQRSARKHPFSGERAAAGASIATVKEPASQSSRQQPPARERLKSNSGGVRDPLGRPSPTANGGPKKALPRGTAKRRRLLHAD